MTQGQAPNLKVVGQTKPKAGVMPPNDLAAETVVLCDLLERPENIAAIRDILRPEDFFSDPNKLIYQAILALDESKTEVDISTVGSYLRERGKLKDVGGASYLADIVGSTPRSSNIMSHVKNVHGLGRKRRMIVSCQVCAAEGYGDTGEDVQAWLDLCARRVGAECQDGRPNDGIQMPQAIDQAIAALQASDGRRGITGVSTGIRTLDSATAGLQKPELVIITGPSGKGKTSLGLSMAASVAGNATTAERGVAIFSMEMADTQLTMRMASTAARVDLQRYRMGQLTVDYFSSILSAAAWLRALPITIDDQKGLSPSEIRGRAIRVRDEQAKQGIKLRLVMVDYIQLADGLKELPAKSTVEQGLDYVAKKLVELAKELDCTVLALAQLNDDGRIRNSRAVEHAADTWIDIERKDADTERYSGANPKNGAQPARLVIRKQRSGPDNMSAPCWWYGSYLLFSDEDNL